MLLYSINIGAMLFRDFFGNDTSIKIVITRMYVNFKNKVRAFNSKCYNVILVWARFFPSMSHQK